MPAIEELQFLNFLLENKNWDLVEENGITEEHFEVYKKVFLYVKDFYKKYNSVPTVESVLNRFDDFERVEIENIEAVIESLNEDLYQRKIRPVLVKAAQLISQRKSFEAVELVAKEANKLLQGISFDGKGYSYVGNAEQRLQEYLKIHGRKKDQILGITTGFKPLDIITNGIERGQAVDYFLVFAPTNMGKTTISSFMLKAGWLAEESDYPAYFALEQRAEEIALNWDNVLARVSRVGLTRGTLTEEEKERYINFIEKLKRSRKDMVIYDLERNGGRPYTVDEIRRILEREGHTRFVLDQLSKVRLGRFTNDFRHRLIEVSAGIRDMILETKIPGYVVAQANREALKRVKKDPTAEVDGGDIGEAFAILQDASKAISIVKVNPNTFKITVIKNRGPGVGQTFLVRYDFETGLVSTLDDEIGEQFF